MNKGNKKFYKKMVVIGVIIFCLILAAPFSYVNICPFVWAQQATRVRVRLLCKTDHITLLKACRELLGQADKGAIERKKYQVLDGSSKDKEIVCQFPKPILNLAPNSVYIDDGRVILEMFPYWRHLRPFGFIAYPENFEKPSPDYKYGDREIIDGLSYYDEEYDRSKDYDKSIQKLMQKHSTK